MTFAERIARFSDRVFDRLRDRGAFTVTDVDAVDGDLEPLRGHAYALLVTFRRTGEPVPSPVWLALDERGRAYVQTAPGVGKVKRLRNDDRVLLAPSTMRGRPVGRAVRGRARILPEAEWPHAEATLAAAYGAGRRILRRTIDEPSTYLEITPRR